MRNRRDRQRSAHGGRNGRCHGRMDSAQSHANAARDPHNQATYTVMKPKNDFDLDPENVTSAAIGEAFNDICNAIHCTPGPKCDPSKIIMPVTIFSDADIDGDSIGGTVLGLAAKHCRPAVEAGLFRRILPPAYSFYVGKKKKFVRSKREFYEYVMKDFMDKVQVSRNGQKMGRKELAALLDMNFEYRERLQRLADHYCCDPKIMEFIAWRYHGDWSKQKRSYWSKALRSHGELQVLSEDGVLVIDGGYPNGVNLALDKHFQKHVARFKEVQLLNDEIEGYAINGEDGKTLCDVMEAFHQHIPTGVKRYKGNGELDVDEVWEQCLNPETRTMITLTFKDFEKDMKKIEVILSGKSKAAEARADILRNIKLDATILDT